MEYVAIVPEDVGLVPLIPNTLWRKMPSQNRYMVVKSFLPTLHNMSYRQAWIKHIRTTPKKWNTWKQKHFKSSAWIVIQDDTVLTHVPYLKTKNSQNKGILTEASLKALSTYITKLPKGNDALLLRILHSVQLEEKKREEKRPIPKAHIVESIRKIRNPPIPKPKLASIPIKSKPKCVFKSPLEQKQAVHAEIERIYDAMQTPSEERLRAHLIFEQYIVPHIWECWLMVDKIRRVAAVCVWLAYREQNIPLLRRDFFTAISCSKSGFGVALTQITDLVPSSSHSHRTHRSHRVQIILHTIDKLCAEYYLPRSVNKYAKEVLRDMPYQMRYSRPEILAGMAVGYSIIVNGFMEEIPLMRIAESLQVSTSSVNKRVIELATSKGYRFRNLSQFKSRFS